MTSSTIKTTFSHRRWRHVAGVMLSLITAIVMIPGMSVYLPFSTPDKIGIPIFLFPFIWVFLFLYAYMARHAWHAWLFMLALCVLHGTLSFMALR